MTFFYKLCHRVVLTFFKLFYGFKVAGAENIPESGRIILASNHISAFDPPAIGVATKRMLFYLAKKELFSIPILSTIIRHLNTIPIDRGAGDIKALKMFTDSLQREHAVLLFPEGTRSRDGKIGEAREGIGFIASKTESDIIPCFIRGTNDLRRNFLTRNGIRVYFGERIEFKHYKNLQLPKRQLYKKISNDVLTRIKQLKDADTN